MTPRGLTGIPVAEAMHRGVVACRLETPLPKVARMMVAHRIHCVVDRGDGDAAAPELWGVVSDLDLVGAAAVGDLADPTAGGISVTPAYTVSPRESLHRAAELMCRHGVSHLVVVDPHSTSPVGVLSSLDLARVLADEAEA